MDLMEITEKERLSREDAAARQHTPPTARQAQQGRVRPRRPASRSTCPDEVDFKLEIEIEDDKRELEIELTW